MSIDSLVFSSFVKTAKELTEEARSHVAKKNFAVSAKSSNTGKPAYPIPDKAHARSALGFAAMHGDKKDIAEVKKDVAKKFPGMVHDKEKDSNFGVGTYGAASQTLPGMVGGPPGGQGMMARMSAGGAGSM